jgi:hypothetical protein
LKCQQKGTHRRVNGQRNLVTGHFDRHPGGYERSGERGDHGAPGANQDCHLTPRTIVAKVCAPQDVCDVLSFCTGAAAGEDLHLALGKVRVRGWMSERLEYIGRQ